MKKSLHVWTMLMIMALSVACSPQPEIREIQPATQVEQEVLPSVTQVALPAEVQTPMPALEVTKASAAVIMTPVIEHSLILTSPLIETGGEINPQYTCFGRGISPPLEWSGPPAGTVNYALIMEDPDAPAGVFVHWVLFNIPADRMDIPQEVPNDETVAGIGVQGLNDAEKIGYFGPCPPQGAPHRYVFKLYALDTRLFLPAGSLKKDLEEAMEGHILDQAEFYATFEHVVQQRHG